MADKNEVPELVASIEIEAPVDVVWELVHDVQRMREWSPQVESTRLSGGATEVGPGVVFTNANREGQLAWKTHATVVRFDPGREFAFRIEENWVVWSFRLETVTADRTLLTQRREAPDGISDVSRDLTDTYLGGQVVFTETLRAGMRRTLAGIRDAALAADRTSPRAPVSGPGGPGR